MTGRFRLIAAAFALVFLTIHLGYLPRSLEDIDSINFAMGVESFDVARHQPHPPGYPVFMAMTKASTAAVGLVTPSWDRDRRAAAGLAVWSVVAGAAAIYVLLAFWGAVGLPPGLALLSSLLVVTTPLFWVTAARPLTDTVGLVAALVVQTFLLRGWRSIRAGDRRLPSDWIVGAAGAGLAIGLRSQSLWLTGPLLGWAVGELLWRRRYRDSAVMVAAAAAAAVAWAVPLVWLTGGLRAYVALIGGQGSEDFGGSGMLAVSPSLQLFRRVVERTLFHPWQEPWLGQVVVCFALVGVARLVRRSPGVLAGLCLAFWPYAVFHATFHETAAVRYALPVVVPLAGLAVVGLSVAGRTVASVATVAIAIAGLHLGQVELSAYSATRAPVFQMLHDMQDAKPALAGEPAVRMHHQVWWGVRRATDWYRSVWDIGPLPFPGDREWLDIVRQFRDGDARPVWLLADLTRTDTVLFDWRSRRVAGRYVRSPGLKRLVGRDRLEEAVWWEIQSPGWMLGRGWALSPEVAGATAQDQRAPHRVPADAFIKRSPAAHRLMIGGRYLGGTRDAVLILTIDGREVARWVVPPSPVWFVRWLDLPAGSLLGNGAYASVTARVEAADGGTDRPELGLEQFDVAAADALIAAFTEGWQEQEENPTTGVSWRWSSDRNTLVVFGSGKPVRLRLSGESPMRYFDRAPTVTVSVGGREVGRFTPHADFDEVITIPAGALAARPSLVTVATDQAFVPAEQGSSPDRRRLGLRLYRVELTD